LILINLLDTSLGQKHDSVLRTESSAASRVISEPEPVAKPAPRIVQLVADPFDALADGWDELFEDPTQAEAWGAFWHPYLAAARVRSVLLVQASTGSRAMALARLGYRVVASDSSLSMLRQATKKAALADVSIEFIHAPVGQLLSLSGPVFDAVIMGRVQSFSSSADLTGALRAISALTWAEGLLLWDPPVINSVGGAKPFRIRRMEGQHPGTSPVYGYALPDGTQGRILIRTEEGLVRLEHHALPAHTDFGSASDLRSMLSRAGYRFFQWIRTPWSSGRSALVAAKAGVRVGTKHSK
jgi:SAM-dependent methyltransferase